MQGEQNQPNQPHRDDGDETILRPPETQSRSLPPTDRIGDIGPYTIIKMLGEGGMGAVFLAEQTKPIHRRVALKIIKLGMDTKQVVARFEAEREALALMEHPNVARVYGAGATEYGRPYFVMEYVDGIPITAYCDTHKLTTEERLKLFVQVCHAVQHAHQKGVIHRDIKPSNVLVTVVDGAPVVKVIDFGIAKATQQRLTEQTLFTEEGQLIGTPGYMSPEQAGASGQDLDTRTDIYSLGVLLYELLVGAPPFDLKSLREAALTEIVRIIREVDPPKPSTRLIDLGDTSTAAAELRGTTRIALAKQLRGDLDWIVMKTLEKDRARRYETASGLALEIQRFLNHEPILAGPPSAMYRIGKFVRRNRLAVSAAVAILLSLAGGLIGTSAMYFQASAAERDERIQRKRAEENEKKAEASANRANRERDKALRVAGFMSETLSGANPAIALGRDATVLKEMMESAERRIKSGELANSPEAELELRVTIGDVYETLGEFARGLEVAEPAMRLAREIHGEEHESVARSLACCGFLMHGKGDYEQARSLTEQALAMRRRLLGDEHADVGQNLRELAAVETSQGNYVEALQLYREAERIFRKVYGEHWNVAVIQNDVVTVLTLLGEFDEAERLANEALTRAQAQLGEIHPQLALILDNLAQVLERKGDSAGAVERVRQSLDMRIKLLGGVHPEVARSENNLAYVMESMGALEDAELHYRKSLDLWRALGETEHREVACTLNNLANVRKTVGDYQSAVELTTQALAIMRKNFGDEHPEVATVLYNFSFLMNRVGKLEEAGRYAREALDIRLKVLGDEHPETALSLNNVAFVAEQSGRLDEAEKMYRDALAIQERALGSEHLELGPTLANLGNLMLDKGSVDEAESLQRRALSIWKVHRGSGHLFVASALANLSAVLEIKREYQEAEALARESLVVTAKIGRPLPSATLAASVIGSVLASRGEFTAAETFLAKAAKDAIEQTDVTPSRRRVVLERVIRVYEAWDLAEPGQGHAAQAADYRVILDQAPSP